MRKGELEDCFPPASESGSVRWRYKVILREDLTNVWKKGPTWQGRVVCVWRVCVCVWEEEGVGEFFLVFSLLNSIYGYLYPLMHFNEDTNMYLFFYLGNVWKKISQSLWGPPPLIMSSNWVTWWISCGHFTSLFQGVVQHDYGWIKKQVSPMRSWDQKANGVFQNDLCWNINDPVSFF